ncbi:MAG: carboxypeptidase-like regulatory domain-containing protein [Gemmatimonadota bacterium]
MGRHARIRTGLLGAWTSAAFLPAVLSAQQVPPSVPVEGWVVGAQEGAPVLGARVWTTGAEPAYTDADGHFSIGALPAGERTLHVTHLTYADLEQKVTFGGGHRRPRLAIELDTVRVRKLREVDRRLYLDRRRFGEFVRLRERAELLDMSGEELLREARLVIPFGGPCERDPLGQRCQVRDGPVVALDDDPGVRRLREMSSLDPHGLYLVELYPDRRFAHAYSVDFIARAMERPGLLIRSRRMRDQGS